MEMKIQKIKSDLLFKLPSKINSSTLNHEETSVLIVYFIFIQLIVNCIKSENGKEMISILQEKEVAKKFLILLIRTEDTEFKLLVDFLFQNDFFFSLDLMDVLFKEAMNLNNDNEVITLSNYLKLLRHLLLRSNTINNAELESQSSLLETLLDRFKDKNNQVEIINSLLFTIKIIYFKYHEMNALVRDRLNNLSKNIDIILNEYRRDINDNDNFKEKEINSVKTTLQNYLTMKEKNIDSSYQLSDLIRLFNKNKKNLESTNSALNSNKAILIDLSTILNEIKAFLKSEFPLNEEIFKLQNIVNLFDNINLKIDDKSTNEIYNSLSKQISNLKEKTKIKIENKIRENLEIIDKKLVINFDLNLKNLGNINMLFPQIFSNLILSIYEYFVRYLIMKNGEFTFDVKDSTTTISVGLRVDQSKINHSVNFNNKIISIKQIFKVLQMFPDAKLDNFKLKYSFIHGEITRTAENNIYYILAVMLKNSFELYKETVITKENPENINCIRNLNEVISFIRTNFEILKDFKFCEEEDLSIAVEDEKSDDKVILYVRDMIVNSFTDIKKNKIKSLNLFEFTKKILFTENDVNDENMLKLKDFISTHFRFTDVIKITENFESVLIELTTLLIDERLFNDRKADLTQKLVNILIHVYKIYFKTLNSTDKVLLLNNLEVLRIMFSIIKVFYLNYIENASFALIIMNINTYLKKLCNEYLSENIQFLIAEINEIIMNFESFETCSSNRYRYEEFLNKISNITLGHFNKWKYLIDKDFLYFHKYITSLIFDRLCKMVLKVKSFSIEDGSILSKLLVSFKTKYKETLIQNFFSSNQSMLEEATLLFDSNFKIKKFDEIQFLLEATLKQVRNFLEYTENIQIEKHELIDYIKSLFEDSSNRMNIINLIEKTL